MTQIQHNLNQISARKPATLGGLSVRTNLRAGLAWDDIDDQAKALWSKLTDAVSNASIALTSGNEASKPAA